MESGKTLAIPFNIFINVTYHHAKVVGNERTFQASPIGVGKLIKKSNILCIGKKQRILAQAMCQPTSPCNLNFKFIIFTCKIF